MENAWLVFIMHTVCTLCSVSASEKETSKKHLSATVHLLNMHNNKLETSGTILCANNQTVADLKNAWLKYKRLPKENIQKLFALEHPYELNKDLDCFSDDKKVSDISGIEKWGIIFYLPQGPAGQ